MAVTTQKRKLKKRRKRSDQRNALLKRSRLGSYARPTDEQLKALGVDLSTRAAAEEEE